ncbi:class I SAM-dependent methyltransferase [Myxococcota bacterium]|nr:class I SAM-dependent methyltransferase [Myxococcota bacterium]
MESPFDRHPEFIETDNRRFRGFDPVNQAFLEAKYETLLPENLVRGRSVLDLGACFGAAGHWALSKGARAYTGVEIQPGYATEARKMLGLWGDRARIIQSDIRTFLDETPDGNFEWVVAAGVLFHFLDTKALIDQMCRVSEVSVTVETTYPPSMRTRKSESGLALIEFVRDQEVNLAGGSNSMVGLSASASLEALDLLFDQCGFSKHEKQLTFPRTADTVIYDQRLLGETSLPLRFAARYWRVSDRASNPTLEDGLARGTGTQRSWEEDPTYLDQTEEIKRQALATQKENETLGSWKFDEDVARRFNEIALREIPDYRRVLDLVVSVVERVDKADPSVLDVGSALGATLRSLYEAGFRKLYGVESSLAMLDRSFAKATLIHSSEFPDHEGPFDVVSANWVLHFMTISERESYLVKIYEGLTPGGILILTDKVSSSPLSHELYYEMKRRNGMTEEEIAKKRDQLEGILTTKPLRWYFDTLETIGFHSVEVINSNAVFPTMLAYR